MKIGGKFCAELVRKLGEMSNEWVMKWVVRKWKEWVWVKDGEMKKFLEMIERMKEMVDYLMGIII